MFEGPVRRHLASAGAGVVRGTDCAEEHFIRCAAEGEAQSAVAVIRVEPVVGGLESQAGSYAESFMACARDLEEDFLLALEQDLAVVNAARHVHEVVVVDELLRSQAFVGLFLDSGCLPGVLFNFGLNLLRLSLCSGHSTSPYGPMNAN